MRTVDLSLPVREHSPRTARLTRHLVARLLDFGPGGPEILATEPELSRVTVRFPGHDTSQVLAQLAKKGVLARAGEDGTHFHLSASISFEDLDHVWGCLFEIL